MYCIQSEATGAEVKIKSPMDVTNFEVEEGLFEEHEKIRSERLLICINNTFWGTLWMKGFDDSGRD